METISNVTSGVSKMVFGESKNETGNEEPVSGKAGEGTVEEPYDQGNREGGPTSPTSPTSPNDTDTKPATGSTSVTDSTGVTDSKETAPSTGVTDSKGATDSEGATKTEGPSGPSAQHPTDEGIQDPSSGQKPEQKQQGGDRPTEEPTEETGTDAAVRASKEEAEQAQKALANKDPNDHSGEPLKMHDAGEKKEEKTEGEGEGETEEKHPGQEGGPASRGTGTEHVKTSGFEAEGGDFDATKPGAGAEADRLLEQKGVKKSTDKAKDTEEGSPAPSGSQGGADSAEKRSMGSRIKDKLHIGKK